MKAGFGPTFTQRVPVLGHVEKLRGNCQTAAAIFNTKLWSSTGLGEKDFKALWQGAPKFSAESVIKNPNQTSLHFYRRSCHPFLRLSQTKYLYYTIFNTDELLMNIWRGPGSTCSYGRVVKGSCSVLFINVSNGLCAHGEESTVGLEREELGVYL